LVRDYLRPGLESLAGEDFDAAFSISVLEHLNAEACYSCFSAFAELLKPRGVSLHCFDFIVRGNAQEHDRVNARRILQSQARVGGVTTPDFDELLQQLSVDIETFYLSPQGHNLWRGSTSYVDFPFRQVVSLQTAVQRA
jgi:cyclopropane fatty-acyl-phospholipid synthase-like methyltransferase